MTSLKYVNKVYNECFRYFSYVLICCVRTLFIMLALAYIVFIWEAISYDVFIYVLNMCLEVCRNIKATCVHMQIVVLVSCILNGKYIWI